MKLDHSLVALVVAVSIVPSLSMAVSNTQVVTDVRAFQSVIWKRLEGANWVLDGKRDAPRIVYVITDPNCVWCHRFWEVSRPWVESGQVQVRHILVGIIKHNSAGKAAAILSAPDKAAALTLHELNVTRGGIAEAPVVSESARNALAQNLRLMRDFGFSGTPAIIYADSRGNMAVMSGFPGERMEVVMGSPSPKK
ncbi:thiol:disulfide interchange protein DsbG [Comamonas sp. wu1-DMT]|uniref:thiol:disulfide interchange protein DsbG n=1 Tax=Comamonas sp. wu1-DMT TaxID=3126390 RepID=UPI0032E489F0